MEENIINELAKKFKIDHLSAWQHLVIANILDAEKGLCSPSDNSEESCPNQIVLLPTGSGKSLCFLLPALVLKGATLVIYPLLALIADQKRRITEAGIDCVIFKGGQSAEEREENFYRIKNGTKIILANPEILSCKDVIEKLKLCNISHIAIDEAHCVSEWGDSFRPAYRALGNVIKELKSSINTAFTATASDFVLQRISALLFNGNVRIVRGSADRENIHYNVINCYEKQKMALMLSIKAEKPLLIFSGTRVRAEDMAREIATYYHSIDIEDNVRFYHAGMQKEEKLETENWFLNKADGILCCTCAYGMGVDKKNIRTVIHLEAPLTIEAYVQEAGRGGRDGKICKAILLWSNADSYDREKYSENSREKVIKNFAEASICRRKILLEALGAKYEYCSTCDVCKRGKSPAAKDAQIVIDLIKRNPKYFSKAELKALASNRLNSMYTPIFKRNIWNVESIDDIIENLINEKKIECMKGLWKGRFKLCASVHYAPLHYASTHLHYAGLHNTF